jgi:hypothetical protein
MTRTPGRWPVPRFTLGRLMAIVAISAGNFAMFKAIAWMSWGGDWPTAVILVALYDALIYLVIQAIRRLFRTGEDDRPTMLLGVLAVLVLASCAGVPLLVLAGAMIGWR